MSAAWHLDPALPTREGIRQSARTSSAALKSQVSSFMKFRVFRVFRG